MQSFPQKVFCNCAADSPGDEFLGSTVDSHSVKLGYLLNSVVFWHFWNSFECVTEQGRRNDANEDGSQSVLPFIWYFYWWHQVHFLLPSNLEHMHCAADLWSDMSSDVVNSIIREMVVRADKLGLDQQWGMSISLASKKLLLLRRQINAENKI